MWWAPIAAAGVSALGNIAGGLLGGGGKGKQGDAENFARQQLETQMQKSIQWRVQDAKTAGVHPLAALGAQVGASPSTPVGDSGSYQQGIDFAGMGQGLARALSAVLDKNDKNAITMQTLQLEGAQIDNQMKLEQLKQMRAAGSPPEYPTTLPPDPWYPVGQRIRPGFGVDMRTGEISTQALPPAADAAGLDRKGSEQFSGSGGMQPSVNQESRWMRTHTGAIDRMPGEAWQMDDMGSPGYVTWQLRNSILPAVPFGARALPAPPKSHEVKGQVGWYYKIGHGYVPVFPEDKASQYSPWFVPLAPR